MKKSCVSKYIFVGAFLSFSIVVLTGCDSLLNKYPLDSLSNGFGKGKLQYRTNSLSNSTFWQTEGDALLALTGVYQQNKLTGTNAKQSFDLWNQDAYLRLFEATTDNGFEKDNGVTDFNNGDLAASYQPVMDLWTTTYIKITKCNNFLENIDNVEMDVSKLEEMKAEVKTIRAYDYFWLAFLWSDVPLVTKVLTVDEANSVFRDSRENVIKFVIEE